MAECIPSIAGAALPYILAGVLSILWGVVELAQTFESDLKRALLNGWSYLFLAGNLLMAEGAMLLLDFSLSPEPSRRLLLGVGVGVGWQALLRTRIHLFQPLGGGREAVTLSVLDFYRRFQRFCWRQIDRSLITKRMALLDKASKLPLDYLKHQVKLRKYASMLGGDEKYGAKFWQRLSRLPEEEQRLYLATQLPEGGPARKLAWFLRAVAAVLRGQEPEAVPEEFAPYLERLRG